MQETILRSGCVVVKPNGTADCSRGHTPISGLYENYVGIFRKPVDRCDCSFCCFTVYISTSSSLFFGFLALCLFFRLISGFEDAVHSEGMSYEEKQAIKSNFMDKPPRQGSNQTKNHIEMTKFCVHNFNVWATHPHNHGCYVKMLTGNECHGMVDLTDSMLEKAIATLKQFRFVGVLEDYEMSVRLFLKYVHRNWDSLYNPPKSLRHGQYAESAPVQPPFPVEVAKHREAHNQCTIHLAEALKLGLLKYDDPYDEAIYKLALDLYDGFKKEYGLGLRRLAGHRNRSNANYW